MMPHRLRTRATHRFRAIIAGAVLVAGMSCSHNNPDVEEEYVAPPQPIPVRVKNENFLDVNVSYVISGVTRRLGTVSGNGTGAFAISWNMANGQTVVLTAIPIGARGGYQSPALSVSPGQVIDLHVGSVFRQSTAVIHEP